LNEDERYYEARKRVQELKGFYIHVIIYVLVNLLFFLVNILRSSDELWFIWSLIGWGVGLAAHAIGVFGVGWVFGQEWERRKVAEIAEKLDRDGARNGQKGGGA
jgi:hypothetical protein